MSLNDWANRIRSLIGGAATDDSDKPALDDSFVNAPAALADPIAAAGGNPRKVVEWFDTGAGMVYRFLTTGQNAERCWRSLRGQHPTTGYWPVILGPNDSIRCHNDLFGDVSTKRITEFLKIAEAVDLDSWHKAKLQENRELDPEYQRPATGEWPERIDRQSEFLSAVNVLTGRPRHQVWIGLLPIRLFWETAAVMRFGDWNAVPPPEIHVALHRRWNEEFGAELVSMTHDTIEFDVARPPTSREAAMRLAELQYDYCPDNVDQGVGSIEALAAMLLGSRIWYFWWD